MPTSAKHRAARRRLAPRRSAGNRSLVWLAAATIVAAGLRVVGAQEALRAGPSAVPSASRPFARLPNGRPDLNGNWSIAVSIADISENIVRIGDEAVAGDGRVIPYTPVYARLRAEADRRMYEEPELHCYMSGVPSHLWRQAYSGAGLVIQETENYVVFLHEFQGSRRIVPLDGRDHIPASISLFMGDGVGHWEGDTLVVETTNNNAVTWLDTGGNRHSDRLVVTERFTPVDNDTYGYEATFVDPEAFTAPWTIAARMSRGPDPNAEILEFACVEGNTDDLHYTEDVGGSSPLARDRRSSSDSD
jgi:hypothetical protein